MNAEQSTLSCVRSFVHDVFAAAVAQIQSSLRNSAKRRTNQVPRGGNLRPVSSEWPPLNLDTKTGELHHRPSIAFTPCFFPCCWFGTNSPSCHAWFRFQMPRHFQTFHLVSRHVVRSFLNCDIEEVLSSSSISRAILPHPKTQIQHHKWHHKICTPFPCKTIPSLTERVVWQEKVPSKVHESAHDNVGPVHGTRLTEF